MKLIIEGLEVLFPYDFVYEEQVKYMRYIKQALDAAYTSTNFGATSAGAAREPVFASSSGHCLLEMPTGTGKTACLLAIIVAYKKANPRAGKLVYCTRTVPEMDKCMHELKRLVKARCEAYGETTMTGAQKIAEMNGVGNDSTSNEGGGSMNGNARIEDVGESLFGICLSSRKNMCINEHVVAQNDIENVDSLCREKTASWVRNLKDPSKTCKYYEGLDALDSNIDIPRGIYSLEDIKRFGSEKTYCPYFLARKLILYSDVIVFNYQYLIDPRIFNMVSKELEKSCTIVFDEAHNIDNVCMEVMSVSLDSNLMNKAIGNLKHLERKVAEVKSTNIQRLENEYRELRDGLARQGLLGANNGASSSSSSSSSTNGGNIADTMMGSPMALLNPMMIEEAMPGNIRKADHFLKFMKKIVYYLKERITEQTGGYQKTLLAFLHDLELSTALERKTLKFSHSRLNSLLRTLEVTNLDEFHPISEVANFATLVSSFIEGFAVIFEPEGLDPLLHLTCLDAAIAMKPITSRFRSVIITSGTLSPRKLYEHMLDFHPVVNESLGMSTFRNCLQPLIVSKVGLTDISTRFEDRHDKNIAISYGNLLVDICKNVPDGVCCFLPSYQYLEEIVTSWEENNIIASILKHKLIFIETKDVVETTLALDMYKKACDRGQGAVFLSISRGKVAEGVDFDRHYGRAVVVMGIPYSYARCPQLLARQSYLRDKHGVKGGDYTKFDAIRQVSQCVGRVIRSKTDYGIVVLADHRFNKQDIIKKFPEWIINFLRSEYRSLDSTIAVELMKQFLREMGQAWDAESLRERVLLDSDQVKFRFPFCNEMNYRQIPKHNGAGDVLVSNSMVVMSTAIAGGSTQMITTDDSSTSIGMKRSQDEGAEGSNPDNNDSNILMKRVRVQPTNSSSNSNSKDDSYMNPSVGQDADNTVISSFLS